jgi:rfaE bifunctional protein nucleotidyltransferase chain/domain
MSIQAITPKIQTKDQAQQTIAGWKSAGERIVFTNGCFDLLHYGHIQYLADARALGDRLIVGLNSSASVSRLKGPHRPINDEKTRAYVLAALAVVDLVVIFDEPTPIHLVEIFSPDLLVKGGDWQPHQIVGSDWVMARGGDVRSLPYAAGYSTTNIEQKIIRDYLEGKDIEKSY